MVNKKRPIDANALIEEANAEGAYGYVDAFQIANAPTVDAVPVRHGRWIEKQEKDTFAGYLYSYECSECGRVKQRKEPYCPNCGAKMDGGRTDEYIEREALMKETDRQRGEFISNKTIQFFPDTDVVPVRHGRWNDWEVFWKECSCCRYRTQKINAREYFFCPKCGAKMDLE